MPARSAARRHVPGRAIGRGATATPRRSGRRMVRGATTADAPAIYELITADADGHLLARTLSDLTEHANRFLVATVRGRIVGCAELAPLSSSVAEVRSFVVRTHLRGAGSRPAADRRTAQPGAKPAGSNNCAPSPMRRPTSPASASRACRTPRCPRRSPPIARRCSLFGTCGQYAMVTELAPAAAFGASASFLQCCEPSATASVPD